MARSIRIESIGGGSGRGVGGGVGGGIKRVRANSSAAAKVVGRSSKSKSKSSSVKVVKGSDGMANIVKNEETEIVTGLRKTGDWAKITAPKTGSPKTTVKIKSGGNIKPAVTKKKMAPSYWELKGLPSLVRVNSGTGNKIVSPITYRGKTTKKAALPPKRATGRRGSN